MPLKPNAASLLWLCLLNSPVLAQPQPDANSCITPLSYWPLDAATVGRDDNGLAALGAYERISPDGRFVLRSYSGGRLGQVTLIELPAQPGAPLRMLGTPLSNEAFPIQGTWRYLVDIDGKHYRFSDIWQRQNQAKPLFRGGVTGFYAAAAEILPDGDPAPLPHAGAPATVYLRSLSWPQGAQGGDQGAGPLQVATLTVQDDGRQARITNTHGPHYICSHRQAHDGSVYALPMLSVDGREFAAIPQAPRKGPLSMRLYSLAAQANGTPHPCALLADLGHASGKAVFGFADGAAPARWITFSDIGHVYAYDRHLQQSFTLAHGKHRVLASAFPGITQDGRIIYAATWHDCADTAVCPQQAGYVVADPYQAPSWRAHWQQRGQNAPKACITQTEVTQARARFSALHQLPDDNLLLQNK